MMIWVIVLIVVVIVGGVWWLRIRRRPDRESVDSFRRQIDALSPEARRPVVDQVQKQVEADDDDPDEGAADGT